MVIYFYFIHIYIYNNTKVLIFAKSIIFFYLSLLFSIIDVTNIICNFKWFLKQRMILHTLLSFKIPFN